MFPKLLRSFAASACNSKRNPQTRRILALEHLEERSLLTVVPTLTTLAASANTVSLGQSVTLTATVTVASPYGGTPVGTVTFFNGSTSLGTATLDSGRATLPSISTLPLGTDLLTASYSGSGNFAASSTAIGPNSTITTVVGGGNRGLVASGPATAASLSGARSVAMDAAGDLFLACPWNNAVCEVNHSTGIITTVAGTGIQGYSGDNGLATAAELNNPAAVASDSAGNLFIVDTADNVIREVNHSTGIITTVTGNGQLGDDGDSGQATAAKLGLPVAAAVDAAGNNLFIVQSWENSVVREVNLATGVITTVAGGGNWIQDPGCTFQATDVELGGVGGVAVDNAGHLFIADSADNLIREVNLATGVMTVVAGTGTRGSTGDRGPAYNAELGDPVGVAVDGAGHLYIAEYDNARIREVNLPTGVITTFAGTGSDGFSGDNGLATAAQLSNPCGIVVDTAGNLCIADYGNNRIRKVNIGTGVITTVAGNRSGGFAGDNGPATAAGLTFPSGIAFDSAGDLFIADLGDNRVREVNHATGVITTVAGGGSQGLGDGGQATAAELDGIGGIAVDSAGTLFIADAGHNRVREVNLATGLIRTIAGTGYTSYNGDGGSAFLADLNHPSDVAVDSAGNLFLADTGNSRVREVTLAIGMIPPIVPEPISTVAGTGTTGYSGENVPATDAGLADPTNIAMDSAGDLFIVDDDRIREVNHATGLISTVAGGGSQVGDGVPATAANLGHLEDVAVDSVGNFFIAGSEGQIWEVNHATGAITTVVGNAATGYGGDNGPVSAAELGVPLSLAVDAAGNVFFADPCNGRIREIASGATAVTVVVVPTVMSLHVSATTAAIWQRVTVTATVTVPASCVGTPTGGYVVFYGGDTPCLGVEMLESGTATLDLQLCEFTLPLGENLLTAYYSGSDDFASCRTEIGPTSIIITVAGSGTSSYSDGIPPTAAELSLPLGVATDNAGNLFIADGDRVREVKSATGVITTVAGNGAHGYSGDNGLATAAELGVVTSVVADTTGHLFIGDSTNNVVREVDLSTGIITTVAGGGSQDPDDCGQATAADLKDGPWGLAVDNFGDLFIAGDNRIREVILSTGVINTFAGNGIAGYSGDGGRANAAELNAPRGIAVDAAGDLFIADSGNNRIREVQYGVITTFDSNGIAGFIAHDSQPTAGSLLCPTGVALDFVGNLFIDDYGNNRICQVNLTTGLITTVAGSGTYGYSGDGGQATAAQLDRPEGIAADSAGNLIIADSYNFRIRDVNLATGIITTIAGSGPASCSGDGGPATAAGLDLAVGVAADSAGNLFILDILGNRIREVNHATGVITTVAGTGIAGYSGDGGRATDAQLDEPACIAVDTVGDLFIADGDRIREVNHATGIITTVAGNGVAGYSGDGGQATAAQLDAPQGIAVDAAGNLFFSDGNRVREVNRATGIITTVAGNGIAGHSGDGGRATAAQLNAPKAIAVDSAGNLYIADSGNNVIREVSGNITTVAGTGTAGYSGDGGLATRAQLSSSGGIALDATGDLFIADADRVRKVNLNTCYITTVVGTGAYGYSGDDDVAGAAELASCGGLAIDAAGDLFIADTGNARIREVAAGSASLTVRPAPAADTIGLYAPTTSTFYLRNTNTAGFATSAFAYGPANSNLITIIGDWNGNGTDTIGLYNPTTSTFFLSDSNEGGFANNTFVFGPANSGMVPIVGDWTGSGTDTIGLYNPTTATFYLRNSNTAGYADTTFAYGPAQSGWTPLVGDWTGNGTDTIGLYNPTTSTFYLRNSNTAGFANTTFAYGPAHSGWTPLAGDWTGTGTDTIGLYNPTTSTFYLRNYNYAGFANTTFVYGPANAGWIPLIGNWMGSGQAAMAAAQVTAPQNVPALAQTDLQPIVNGAITLWNRAGSDLPGRYLGETAGNVSYLDTNAAGNGLFIDPTPASNQELTPSANGQQLQAVDPRALDRIDLSTVMEHELGQIAGVGDLDAVSDDLLSSVLGVGVRRDASHQDAVDAALAF